MSKRKVVLAVFAVAIVIAVNVMVYTSVLNGTGTMVNLAKKLNFAYITPKTYFDIAKRLPRRPDYSIGIKQLDIVITDKSQDFVSAAFQRDEEAIGQMLDSSAKYVQSKDGSSFIRHISSGTHVEGYMATDKKLIKATQRWHVLEDDNTVTCSMEVYIEDMESPQLWYLHFKKVKNDWKLFMLENDI